MSPTNEFPGGLTVGVIGAGAMGRGIAQVMIQAGLTVRLTDVSPEMLDEAVGFVDKMVRRQAEKGKISEADAEAALGRLNRTASTAEFGDCSLVIEAIVEKLEVKQSVFSELENIVAEDAILASNTSSLSITQIAAPFRRTDTVAGLHFFNPVPLMKLAEVIPGVRTEAAVVDRLKGLVTHIGHRPVQATDTPGFLVNHAGRAFPTEAFRIVSEGIAAFHGVDNVLREAAGFRMGPFELMDLTGLDVSLEVMESVYHQYYEEAKYRPAYLARLRHAAGLIGRKTGEGFYVYEDGQPRRPADPAPESALPASVWLGAMEPAARQTLAGIAESAGVSVATDAETAALCLVAPLGADVSTTAAEHGLDATRTVGVDPLLGFEGRRTLMTNPVTDAASAEAARALLAQDGTPVTRIQDSPGFVAQRMLAMVVNIACDIAQQRVATPGDIDTAVKRGLGYPKGPLEWGDALGADRVLAILESLYGFYHDPRYRPSPWLIRRARLAVSLTTPEG